MKTNIIQNAIKYTRPLLVGRLFYENKDVSNDILSLIVINKNGDFITTANNADIFIQSGEYNEIYPPILKEIANAKRKNKLEEKYGIKNNTIVGLSNMIIDVAEKPGKLKITKHPYLDLALVQVGNKEKILVDNYPIFASKTLNVGDEAWSVGFALPEYKAFAYDEENYKIKSTYEFMNFPTFTSAGIVCRNIADKENCISMFEMTNLIFTGQEGGPVIDKKGNLQGMIIGFRIINDAGVLSKIGVAINKDEIMKFLDDNKIEYEVENEK